MNSDISTNEYLLWLEGIKLKIKTAQLRVAVSANAQIIGLYWDLAKDILRKQKEASWGDAILDQLSVDLSLSFPNIKGFSRRNLYAIRQWYLFYSPEFEFVPQAVAQIPWGHNRLIISKIKEREKALFYCIATLEQGWNRDHLELAIENKYFESKGKSITNFKETLPSPQSYSWGSARETFDWADMCNVKLPIPDIKIQEAVVTIYHTLETCKRLNEQLKNTVKPLCLVLMRGVVESFKLN